MWKMPPLTGALILAIFTASLDVKLFSPLLPTAPSAELGSQQLDTVNNPNDGLIDVRSVNGFSYQKLSYYSFDWARLGESIGFLVAWCIADHRGRVRGLIQANNIRVLASLLFLLNLLIRWNQSKNDDPSCQFRQCHNLTFFNVVLNGSHFLEGIHSGLSSIIGIIYAYEISPAAWSPSILSLYFLLKVVWTFLIACFITPMTIYPVNLLSWTLVGLVSLFVCILQGGLLRFFCPETPSYLAIHKGSSQLASEVLRHLRSDPNSVPAELEVMLQTKSKSVKGSFKRSIGLIVLVVVYGVFLSATILGSTFLAIFYFAPEMSLLALSGVYIIAIVGSLLWTIFRPPQNLYQGLFEYYSALKIAYFLIAGLACLFLLAQSICFFLGLLISCIAAVIFCRCVIITHALIFQYSGGLFRVNLFCTSLFLGGISAGFVLLGIGAVGAVLCLVGIQNPILAGVALVSLVLIKALTECIQNVDTNLNKLSQMEAITFVPPPRGICPAAAVESGQIIPGIEHKVASFTTADLSNSNVDKMDNAV